MLPSSTLSAIPRPSGPDGAEQAFGSALRRPALELAHQQRVGRHRAADQLRVRAHRGRHAGAAVDLLQPREHQRHPLERQREGDHAAAVDRRRDLLGRDVGRRGDLGEAGVLDRMRRQPVAAARPAVHPAEREHPGVLAGAVVLERRRLGAALELVLGRGRLREQAADRGELLGRGEVRGGRDRDLLRRQVVARADERQRLERLRRRAEVGDPVRRRRPARRPPRRGRRRRGRGASPRRPRRAARCTADRLHGRSLRDVVATALDRGTAS